MKKRRYSALFVLPVATVMMSLPASDSAFADEILINTHTTDLQRFPSVVSDGMNYLVGWNSEGQDGSLGGVYGQLIQSDGSKHGSEFRINTNTLRRQGAIHVGSNGSNFLAVWDSQEWSDNQAYTARVRGQLLDANGAKIGSEIHLSENVTSRDSWNYGVAANGLDYLTTWGTRDHSSQYARRISGSGSPIGAEVDLGIYSSHFVQVASNGTNSLLTWSLWDGASAWEIRGRLMRPDGIFFGPELHVNTFSAGNEEFSRIASDGSNYLITWQGNQEGSYGVYGKVMSGFDGSAVSDDLHINSYTTDGQHPSGLASNGEDYLVTWLSTGQDGDSSGVYARLIGGDGSFIGSEFRVNSYTAGEQAFASVASDGSDYFIVWSGEGSADSSGIYGSFLEADDHSVFGYLTDAGANPFFAADWELADLNQLYSLYAEARDYTVIDGEIWHYVQADFSRGGIWGEAHGLGDSWLNKGSKYILLSANSGLATKSSTAPVPGSMLLFASGLLGMGALRKVRS